MLIHFFGRHPHDDRLNVFARTQWTTALFECGLFQANAANPSSGTDTSFRPETARRGRAQPRAYRPLRQSAKPLPPGYGGNIYCTFATRDPCRHHAGGLRRNSTRRRGVCLQKTGPDGSAASRTTLHCQGRRNKPCASSCRSTMTALSPVIDGVTVTFRDAGHILGSAQVILDIRESGPPIPVSFQRRHRSWQRRHPARSDGPLKTWTASRSKAPTATVNILRNTTPRRKSAGSCKIRLTKWDR